MGSVRGSAPDVTYVMAAHNAAPWIEAAIASALAQEGVHVEVIVVDDASRDGTAALAEAIAERDCRVVTVRLTENQGPSAARNLALNRARGEWVGVLDADDLIEPTRTRRLIALARETGCALVADDVLRFLDAKPDVSWPLLASSGKPLPSHVGLAEYLARNCMTGGEGNLGFLKPIVARDFLVQHGLCYDERLRIGEDFNLYLRCLAAGTDLVILPEPLYRYRVLQGSLSRNLEQNDLEAMRTAHADVHLPLEVSSKIRMADAAYRASISDLIAYVGLRQTLHARQWSGSLRQLLRPRVWKAAARVVLAALTHKLSRFAVVRAGGS